MMVSMRSAERYAMETGTVATWITNPEDCPTTGIDPDTGLSKSATPDWGGDFILSERSLAREESLLMEAVGSTASEILASGSSRRPAEHPLIRELTALRGARRELIAGTSLIDHAGVVQAGVDLRLLRRWHGHPFFHDVVDHLSDGDNYRSSIASLAAASLLADCGNGVSLGARDPSGRRFPDLNLLTEPDFPYGAEVKAPRALVWPIGNLAAEAADAIVRKAIGKALGTGAEEGQIRKDRPGLLVVGGYFMPRQNCTALKAAAEKSFVTDGTQAGLMAVVVLNITAYLNMRRISHEPMRLPDGQQARSVFELDPAEHPSYAGRVYPARDRIDIRRGYPAG
jgi:hypothetical protein